jgi:enoyl-[acyl-carrier protein] reductase I
MADDYDMPKGSLMKGKKGVVTGVANHQSIAWGITSQLAAQGATMSLLHLPGMERRVEPLAESVGIKSLASADVTDDASMDAAFAKVEKDLGTLDFFVHAIAFANKDELKGSFIENTTREGFLRALNISAFSFVDCARRAARLMPNGGSIVTLTYLGAERAIPNYNTMGVAKAALEAAVRYAARDLGPKGIRVNTVSAGPLRTMAGKGIPGFDAITDSWGRRAPLGWDVTDPTPVGNTVAFLLSDLSRGITGEMIHVDGGFHAMGTDLFVG